MTEKLLKTIIAEHKPFSLNISRFFSYEKTRDLINFLIDVSEKEFVFNDIEFKKLKVELIDTSKWSNFYTVVLKINGNLYITQYSHGEDESPYEYDCEIEFFPAKEVPTISLQGIYNGK